METLPWTNGLGLKNSEPRCFACYAKLRLGPKASAPTGHCCHHHRACGFPAGIADYLARKSSRELAARAKRMFSGPCSRPSDAIAKRSRLYVTSLMKDPHTKFQRLATNNARGGRPRFPTQFDFNIIIVWVLKTRQELCPKDYYSSSKNTIPKRNISVVNSLVSKDTSRTASKGLL